MSQRHDDAFRNIRREHDDAVAPLKQAKVVTKRGSPGVAAFDSERLDSAIATAGDAYALLLIATSEAFLREHLHVPSGKEQKLSSLIDQSVKSMNCLLGYKAIGADAKRELHNLRIQRNTYAHGHGRSVFPSVPKVESIVARFLHDFP
jgi:hypothetical protein